MANKVQNPTINEDFLRKFIAQMLLDSVPILVDNLVKANLGVVNDYIIEFRKKLLSGIELKTIPTASKLSGIPTTTLYTWIALGKLASYEVDKYTVVSMTQLNGIKYSAKSKDSTLKDTILPSESTS